MLRGQAASLHTGTVASIAASRGAWQQCWVHRFFVGQVVYMFASEKLSQALRTRSMAWRPLQRSMDRAAGNAAPGVA